MLKYRSDQDYFFLLDNLQWPSPAKWSGAQGSELCSKDNRLKPRSAKERAPEHGEALCSTTAAGQASREGLQRMSLRGALLLPPPCHRLQVQLSGLIPLARPPRSTQGLPRNLFGRTTCGTVSSGAEIKPIPNPLAIQIVINNFSPWKHCALPGRRAVPDGLCTHRELEQVSDCTKTHR